LRVNDAIRSLFFIRFPEIRLGKMKLTFGFDKNETNNNLFLAGEMSPENLDLWSYAGEISRNEKYEIMRTLFA
jgi:hypothetical protein